MRPSCQVENIVYRLIFFCYPQNQIAAQQAQYARQQQQSMGPPKPPPQQGAGPDQFASAFGHMNLGEPSLNLSVS